MATLEHLVGQRDLLPYDVDLEDAAQPERYLYAVPNFVAWFNNRLELMPRDRGRDLTPYEQVAELLYEFVQGKPLAYSVHCRKLDPHSEGVWELKTTDVRIFGWFVRRATFVMVEGTMKRCLRSFKAYAPFVARVVSYRMALPLDEPKFLPGGAMRDVL